MIEIQKYIPRQPQRLNEISYRFQLADSKKKDVSPETSKMGPIDMSILDNRKGPGGAQSAASPAKGQSMGGAMMGTAKTTGGFMKGLPGSASGAEEQIQLHKDKMTSKEDKELGIDRTQVDPIKFVSAIDSKPIYPPYLQLADFDSYLLNESLKQQQPATE